MELQAPHTIHQIFKKTKSQQMHHNLQYVTSVKTDVKTASSVDAVDWKDEVPVQIPEPPDPDQCYARPRPD